MYQLNSMNTHTIALTAYTDSSRWSSVCVIIGLWESWIFIKEIDKCGKWLDNGVDNLIVIVNVCSQGWKRMWFALHGKKLSYFKKVNTLTFSSMLSSSSLLQEREEIASIDLRRMTDFKGPEQATTYEASCSFSIILPDRYDNLSIIMLHVLTYFILTEHTNCEPTVLQRLSRG